MCRRCWDTSEEVAMSDMGEANEAEGTARERIVALKLLPQAISWTAGIGTRRHISLRLRQGAVRRLMSVSTPREHA